MAAVKNSLTTVVALLTWGDLLEDFLDTINIFFDSFLEEMTGGWLFGYVDSLKAVGVETVIFCVSTQVEEPTYYVHKPTGATVCLLPSPRFYRWIRQFVKSPYGWELYETFGPRPWWSFLFWLLLKSIMSYAATPLDLLANEIQRMGCSVILCQEYEYPRFDICMVLRRRLNLPVFATFQGGNFQLSPIEKYIRPYTIRQCNGLIVASQVEIDRVQKTYNLEDQHIAKIFNPLDLDLWQSSQNRAGQTSLAEVRCQLGIPLNATVVIYHGRMERYRKGLDILLDAWDSLSSRFPENEWWLLLVGTGSDVVPLRDRISTLPKTNVCWVNEYILDRQLMQRYLRVADLYVLPSRHEGFPVAPLEAMACGLPIVATDVPGIADILEQGEESGGIRVPCEDPSALASAMERLFKDADLRQQMGWRARQRVEEKFSLAAVGHELQRFILANP
ncbi:MAG: glycosyltransferase family 1 protein [Leptolyngbya sp. DLM2.Bin27]|nr:MAG: glycosyltransferase family 1 protein [Leptolyngbya sp. DLM2.Bin27]